MSDQPRPIPLCSICGGPQEPWPGGSGGYGNNAWPINHGRCCNACNTRFVIPARIADILGKETPHDV